MTQILFITGTDTGVGKTRVACALILAARAWGLRVAGYKPVAAGCEQTDEGLRNEDALALQAASSGALAYESVNPIALPAAIAPHLAAQALGQSIDVSLMDRGLAALAAGHDLVVVEGAGGWAVPLLQGPEQALSYADWVADHQWPVILTVGMRLGCLNHAQLSAAAISQRCRLLGWVANLLPPQMPALAGNLSTLQACLPAPLLARVAANQTAQQAGQAMAADDSLRAALKI